MIERLISSRFRVRSVLLHPQRWERMANLLSGIVSPVYLAPADVMDEIAGFPVHRGALALAERGRPIEAAAIIASDGPLLVLEDVGDPDNIGALFRAAAAFGYTGVLLSPATADPLYRKSIRSSMGWTLHVPFATLEPWPSALDTLRRHIVALTPDPTAANLRTLGVPRAGAVLLGAEGPGLSGEALDLAHVRARIPMSGSVDSLNVAVAASIAMYELAHR